MNEKVGKYGLEYEFQDELRGLGLARTISFFTDAAKRPLNGLGIRESTDENHALNEQKSAQENKFKELRVVRPFPQFKYYYINIIT